MMRASLGGELFQRTRVSFPTSSVIFAVMYAVPLVADPSTAASSTAGHLATRVHQADAQRFSGLGTVTSNRRYVLRNNRWATPAIMHARMISTPGHAKRFEIVSMEHAGVLQKRVFKQVLEGEVAMSVKQLTSKSSETDTSVSAGNYDFALLGHELVDGRQCAVLQLNPKRKSKYLIKGKAWVDIEAAAILRVEGQTAASISFWIGKPLVTQSYRKVDEVWLPSSNRSVSDVRFLGDTEMTIEYLTYTIAPSSVKAAGAYTRPRAE
ncbi:MAG TPA: outer membrane lipoprotein-sorting protein [Bryobacteraceae bacterium]|nr:outer membrane lipoprotein-sorting protein [Bryobacteraceae bacterium]